MLYIKGESTNAIRSPNERQDPQRTLTALDPYDPSLMPSVSDGRHQLPPPSPAKILPATNQNFAFQKFTIQRRLTQMVYFMFPSSVGPSFKSVFVSKLLGNVRCHISLSFNPPHSLTIGPAIKGIKLKTKFKVNITITTSYSILLYSILLYYIILYFRFMLLPLFICLFLYDPLCIYLFIQKQTLSYNKIHQPKQPTDPNGLFGPKATDRCNSTTWLGLVVCSEDPQGV